MYESKHTADKRVSMDNIDSEFGHGKHPEFKQNKNAWRRNYVL